MKCFNKIRKRYHLLSKTLQSMTVPKHTPGRENGCCTLSAQRALLSCSAARAILMTQLQVLSSRSLPLCCLPSLPVVALHPALSLDMCALT